MEAELDTLAVSKTNPKVRSGCNSGEKKLQKLLQGDHTIAGIEVKTHSVGRRRNCVILKDDSTNQPTDTDSTVVLSGQKLVTTQDRMYLKIAKNVF